MRAADGLMALLLLGITAYAVTAGADLGAGIWHLLSRRPADRALVMRVMGPVWEANQVWLVFVVITLFGGFPAAFGQLSRALYVPLVLALLALVLRGAAYVFAAHGVAGWGTVFGLSSLAAPALLAASVAATATGRLVADDGATLLTPLPLVAAVLAVLTCAYLAAVYLCRDAERDGLEPQPWRRRALATALLAGAVALAALSLLPDEAPVVWAGLRYRGLPFVAASVLSGGAAVGLLRARRYRSARVAAAGAPAALLLGWGSAQHPWLVVDSLTAASSVPPGATGGLVLAVLSFGFAVIVPSLALLMTTFQRPPRERPAVPEAPSADGVPAGRDR